MKYLIFIFSLFLIGCNSSSSSSSDSSSTTTTTVTTISTQNIVKVFTLAPVMNALVTDSNNQVATFDENNSQYIFENSITYPIIVKPTSQTFIDVDYDKNKTAIDINPKFTILKSFTNEVNYLTNLYYSSEYNDSNISTLTYISLIQDKFDIDIQNSPTSDKEVAKILFATYDYIINNHNLVTLNDIDSQVDNINNFFSEYLDNLDINTTQYYSSYDALLQLDKKTITRVDTLHKPHITILRDEINFINSNNTLDVFDTFIKDDFIYTAAGHEELQLLDNNLNLVDSTGADLLSFGRHLYYEEYDNNQCLFLSNSRDGFKVFDISNNNITNHTANIIHYTDKDDIEQNLTDDKLLSTNGYISPQNSKRLLALNTNDKGMFLINIKDIFNGCNITGDIDKTNVLIPDLEKGIDKYPTISTVFRNDGSYLYTSSNNLIYGYDLEVLDKDNIASSKISFTIQNSEQAYNLMLVNNDNELFVTTNKGIQLYDVDNSNNLNFISEYTTEGANTEYYPRIDFYDNYLFFTDGYSGLKVIKYDTSFNPMLCGVEYFAPSNNSEELAQVNSVKYQDGYLYVGIDSYGIVKFKMEDILFKHCKE